MPDQETLERGHEDAAEGKTPSTQAGEFVHEEIEHVREGNFKRLKLPNRATLAIEVEASLLLIQVHQNLFRDCRSGC